MCRTRLLTVTLTDRPYMVGTDKGNMKSSVFFVWGSLCTCALVYTFFLVPETKGLSLEQVDKMMEETTPRQSSKWVPTTTFASTMAEDGYLKKERLEQATAGAAAV
jgi:hypothetical protein